MKILAPSEEFLAPSEEFLASSEEFLALSEEILALSEKILAPSEEIEAPSQKIEAPSQKIGAPDYVELAVFFDMQGWGLAFNPTECILVFLGWHIYVFFERKLRKNRKLPQFFLLIYSIYEFAQICVICVICVLYNLLLAGIDNLPIVILVDYLTLLKKRRLKLFGSVQYFTDIVDFQERSSSSGAKTAAQVSHHIVVAYHLFLNQLVQSI
jgi:hypothetical protein